MSVRFAAAAVALLAAAPLAAQQETGKMAHDTGMMAHDTGMMAHDTGMMGHDTGMMGRDTGMMAPDSGMMDHGMMKDEGMGMGHGENMMFSGAGGAKASGDYEIADVGGRKRLTLTADFAVADAPDLYLLLSSGPTDKDALTLGKLKRPAAGQSFDLPKGKDLGKYTTLVVWSKKEKRAVATADWHAPDAMGR
jgi:hypothetical protein